MIIIIAMPTKERAPKRKEGPGRPSLIDDPTKRTRVIDGVRRGLTQELACQCAGISYETLNTWRKIGQADKLAGKLSKYAVFSDEINEAEAEHADTLLARVSEASKDPKYWQAGMAILERRHRKHYGKDAGDIQEMKELLARFVEGSNPELEKAKKEIEELKTQLAAKDAGK